MKINKSNKKIKKIMMAYIKRVLAKK